jgi:hypothetical protein
MAFPAPPFSALMILFAVSLADFADTVEQLVNARLGNAELGGDLFHVVPHKLLHFERPRNADIFGIHQVADSLVFQLGHSLLVQEGSVRRLVTRRDELIPRDDGRLAICIVRALGTENGVRESCTSHCSICSCACCSNSSTDIRRERDSPLS